MDFFMLLDFIMYVRAFFIV